MRHKLMNKYSIRLISLTKKLNLQTSEYCRTNVKQAHRFSISWKWNRICLMRIFTNFEIEFFSDHHRPINQKPILRQNHQST